MNLHHLGAFFWLHWRLRVNQIKRGGTTNQIILAILAVKLVLLAISLFVGSFFLALLFEKAPPLLFLVIWDVLIVCFLAWWCLGLMVELQRAEALSLTKFLHLPVSLSGVFVLNYLSSLFSVNLALFVPAMVGFSLGLVFALGPVMLLLLPLVAAFFLMVTGVSYQFQGWVASLMVDKRRRRTVIFIVTVVFILIIQLPNLINFIRPWESEKHELPKALATKEVRQETWQQVEQAAWFVNLALPPGWLPLGAMALAERNVLPALLGTLGMTLIGGASLLRAYRTTVRLYTGGFTAGTTPAVPVAAPVAAVKAEVTPQPPGLMALQLPWLTEPAAAVTLAYFRSLTRAPEARMLLLTPIFLLVIFGGIFSRGNLDPPDMARPLMAYGAIATILLSLVQLVGNQFGFDRSGFRVFVLGPAPRRDILLGKNLAVAPLAFALVCPLIVLVQAVYPMRLDHLVAVVPQFVSMYLLFCLVANMLSIFAPMPIAAGSLKAANTRVWPILLQMLIASLFPLALAPTLLPLGVEFALETLEWSAGVPICLLLTVLECAGIVWLYRLIVGWQGGLLQAREQRILETVTTKAE